MGLDTALDQLQARNQSLLDQQAILAPVFSATAGNMNDNSAREAAEQAVQSAINTAQATQFPGLQPGDWDLFIQQLTALQTALG